jgi:gamma-glutamyltranspeptidase
VPEFGPFSPARVKIEPGVARATLTELAGRGHLIEVVPDRQSEWGPVSMIRIDPPDFATAPDPRVDTTSAVLLPVS